MSVLDELTKIAADAGPKDWKVVASEANGLPTYFFEWQVSGKRVGGLAVEVFPEDLVFLGLDVESAGQGVFRNLCRVLPKWARERGINRFVVPCAQSEQMRELLTAAGFQNTQAMLWEANIRESDAVQEYGKAKAS